MTKQRSLDYLAMTAAQKITDVLGEKVKKGQVEARDLETLVTKALGVLQSQGVYAMALFLFSRSGKDTKAEKMKSEERAAVQILSWLWPLRQPFQVIANWQNGRAELTTDKAWDQVNNHKRDMLQAFADLSQNLDTLLLVRDLYEQTLIYARYGAKAAKGE